MFNREKQQLNAYLDNIEDIIDAMRKDIEEMRQRGNKLLTELENNEKSKDGANSSEVL